jgi:hypothetical protein
MQQISIRRQKQDNQNNKRYSTSIIDNNDQEEKISSQSPYLTLLIHKFGIPKEKALVNKYISYFFILDYLENVHV